MICVAALCAACMAGCLKGYDGKVVYVLKPLISDGSLNEDYDRYIMAYAFYADTTHWTVASYEDAVAMRITEKTTGDTRTEPAAVAEPFVESVGDGHFSVEMELRPRKLMLVAVDEELKVYGYREQTLNEGLRSIFETVIFYTSRNAKRYKAGQWMMCNDFYTAPEPEPEPDPEDPEDPEEPDNPDEGDDDPDNPGQDDPDDGGDADEEGEQEPDEPENDNTEE